MNTNMNKKGSGLIFVFAMLIGLGMLSATFLHCMSSERRTSWNYSNKVAARLAALAGLEYAYQNLLQMVSASPYTLMRDNPQAPQPVSSRHYSWHYRPVHLGLAQAIANTDLADSEAVLSYQLNPQFWELGWGGSFPYHTRFSGAVGTKVGSAVLGTYEKWGDTYALKILDCAGQLNLNSHYSLDAGPAYQTSSNHTLARMVRTLAVQCGFQAQEAQRIAHCLADKDPDPLSGQRWADKDEVLQQLRQLFPTPTASQQAAMQYLLNCVTTVSWIDPDTAMIAAPSLDTYHAPHYVMEKRAPININTAPRPVLIAVLEGLQARPILWSCNVDRRPSEDGVIPGGETLADDYELGYTPMRISSQDLYIDSSRAAAIADAIITYRLFSPFRDWHDFSDFITSQVGVPPDTHHWANQMNPAGGTDNTLGTRIWRQAFHDMLRANFNPNTLDNTFNPNLAAYLRTAKADLFDDNGRRSHSTEFCFCSWGRYEIVSLGRITARHGQEMARSIIRMEVQLADVLRHTTQAQFHERVAGHWPVFHNTTSYPEITALFYPPDPHAGRIEPSLLVFPDAPYPEVTYPRINEQHPFLSAGSLRGIPLSDSERFQWMQAQYGWLDARSMYSHGLRSVRHPANHLTVDGLFSARTQVASLNETRYFSIHALRGIKGQPPYGEDEWRGVNLQPNANLPYYKGAMEFWVKLTEDSNAQIGCGLFSASLVNPSPVYYHDQYQLNLPPERWPYTEGTQFYIFKNSLGELRFSRIYFSLCWDLASKQQIGTLFNTDADNYNKDGSRLPLDHIDSGPIRFAYPRRDLVIRAADLAWPLHTWHHVYLKWNDSDPAHLMQVWINGDPIDNFTVQIVSDRIRGGLVPPPCNQAGFPEYCVLNEYNPRECFNICGFFRPQWQEGGIFKFDQNVNFPANATISDLRVYPTDQDPVALKRSRFASGASFTHQFRISQHAHSAFLLWTAYPARQYLAQVSLKVYNTSDQLVSSFDTQTDELSNDLAAMSCYGEVRPGYRVQYTFKFQHSSGDPDLDPLLNGTLDDVTLVLIHPRILRITESPYVF